MPNFSPRTSIVALWSRTWGPLAYSTTVSLGVIHAAGYGPFIFIS